MSEKHYDDNPTITDTVIFDLKTSDDVYKISQVTIYYISRGRSANNDKVLTSNVLAVSGETYFEEALPVAIFGNDDTPAYLVTDSDNAFLEKLDFDEDGYPLVGVYRLVWNPELVREGDFALCYRWTVIPAGDEQSLIIPFYLYGNTGATTVIPTHRTKKDKYEILLERYTPLMYKQYLCFGDETPDTIQNLNLAVAKGFTDLEDLGNQIIDVLDANATNQSMLPYLANLFHIKLRSNDIALWRRQIKTAVEIFKQKGTLKGLTAALANAGATLTRYVQLWQIKSNVLRTDSFTITNINEITFILSELAMLPIDPNNFEVAIRLFETTEYQILSSDYVTLENVDGKTIVTWVGNDLSVGAIDLQVGDILRILYQTDPIINQSIEDYIRTLSLMDQRDETIITYPPKNWNIKVIEETDPLFPILCPFRNPRVDPVVFGKIVTEFPYSEKAYNMDEYNFSRRDSTSPCDIGKEFQEPCGCCLSSKFNLDVEISDLSADRVSEVWDVVNEYRPFHAIPHIINYTGSIDDFILSPLEEIEVLGLIRLDTFTGDTQVAFNRVLEDSRDQSAELRRNELATPYNILSTSGMISNDYVVFYSPGVSFNSMPVGVNNLLEILGGTSAGRYTVIGVGDMLQINQGTPDSTFYPLDTSEVPYRLSQVLYSQNNASIYQQATFTFSGTGVGPGVEDGWTVQIPSGIYAGSYSVIDVGTDGGLILSTFPTAAINLPYNVKDTNNNIIFSGTDGIVDANYTGQLVMDLVAVELGIKSGDYIEYSGIKYLVLAVLPRELLDTTDTLILDGYTGGDVVGIATIGVLNYLSQGIGFLDHQGLTLNGAIPPVDGSVEDSTALNDFRILIGTDYYQIVDISGSNMQLVGSPLTVGIVAQSISYDIIQFVKTSPIVTQHGVIFELLDRRGNDEFIISEETASPMWLAMSELDSQAGVQRDMVGSGESISVSIEYR